MFEDGSVIASVVDLSSTACASGCDHPGVFGVIDIFTSATDNFKIITLERMKKGKQ